jgi:hypothetical protein
METTSTYTTRNIACTEAAASRDTTAYYHRFLELPSKNNL